MTCCDVVALHAVRRCAASDELLAVEEMSRAGPRHASTGRALPRHVIFLKRSGRLELLDAEAAVVGTAVAEPVRAGELEELDQLGAVDHRG